MSIGKFSASGISFNNENTAALANVTIDLSLVRCNAPIEFAGIGTALTTKRKHEAENGGLHETAVKLGYLFLEMIPDTPELTAAFGKRVSEILETPGINPKGTEKDGPFREFVGAECSSIWAAATSARESISVVMLACLLARAWPDKEAISIWVEIIDLRKQQISEQVQSGRLVNPYSILAARKNYTRSELALWDASTRAWLARADTAMNVRLTQLRLVRDNVKVPFRSYRSTFDNVVTPWIQSMKMTEALLKCQPQELTSGVGLFAMSAWHLFPDLIVLQTKSQHIPFKDILIPKSSTVTIGLEYDGSSENIARWSLSLSHLQHYGDPVVVRSSGSDNDQVPIAQIWVAMLGVVFSEWGVPYGKFDEPLEWLSLLHDLLTSHGDWAADLPFWILRLSKAAALARSKELANSENLIKYGYRRGNGRGRNDRHTLTPAFGLRNPSVLQAVTTQTDEDRSIVYLRSIANMLGLKPRQGRIKHFSDRSIPLIYVPEPSPMDIISICEDVVVQDTRQYNDTSANTPSRLPSTGLGNNSYETMTSAYQRQPVVGSAAKSHEIIVTCGSYELHTPMLDGRPNSDLRQKMNSINARMVPWSEACQLLRNTQAGQHKDGLRWALSVDYKHINIPRYLTANFFLLREAENISSSLPHDAVSLKIVEDTAEKFGVEYNVEDWRLEDPFEHLNYMMSVIVWMETARFVRRTEAEPSVFAIAFKDRIYIAEMLLADPSESKKEAKVRCIVGNIGHSGLALLVAPKQMRMRPPSSGMEDIQSVQHLPYDKRIVDSFGSTTLHLCFTGWEAPLDSEDTGTFDSDHFFLEAFVSVRQCGKWVADINILETIDRLIREWGMYVFREEMCTHGNFQLEENEEDHSRGLVSIDTWEEFFDFPPCGAVFRAHGNWAARLAAACIQDEAEKRNNPEIYEETNPWRGLGCTYLVIAKGGKICCHCAQYRRSQYISDDNLLYIL